MTVSRRLSVRGLGRLGRTLLEQGPERRDRRAQRQVSGTQGRSQRLNRSYYGEEAMGPPQGPVSEKRQKAGFWKTLQAEMEASL